MHAPQPDDMTFPLVKNRALLRELSSIRSLIVLQSDFSPDHPCECTLTYMISRICKPHGGARVFDSPFILTSVGKYE